jgi:hypothetical protein
MHNFIMTGKCPVAKLRRLAPGQFECSCSQYHFELSVRLWQLNRRWLAQRYLCKEYVNSPQQILQHAVWGIYDEYRTARLLEGNEAVQRFYIANGYAVEQRVSMGKKLY